MGSNNSTQKERRKVAEITRKKRNNCLRSDNSNKYY